MFVSRRTFKSKVINRLCTNWFSHLPHHKTQSLVVLLGAQVCRAYFLQQAAATGY